jgi:NADPH2:quinone reductase
MDGKLKPHISFTFPLEETPSALQALVDRKSTGKVIVAVRESD